MARSIVLLSGGLDSAVALYQARERGEVFSLIFDYGQKARVEIEAAKKIACSAGSEYATIDISFPSIDSSLVDPEKDVPDGGHSGGGIPDTYVPARNMLFLSYGVSYAEFIRADSVFIGAHQLDFSNYPDCRDVFFDSYRRAVETGTRSGVEGRPVDIVTPLINMTKKEIVEKGLKLKVPFEMTWSCYSGGTRPCGKCESCEFRAGAFKALGISDPAESVLNGGKDDG